MACGKCVEYCPAGAVKLGQKLCDKHGNTVEYPKHELPHGLKWGEEHWDPDYRDNNRKNCYDKGTAPCKTACPAHVAVQAGQHVLHALHGTAVTGKVIAGGQDGGYLAAGEVVQGYAHGSSKKMEVAGWAGEPGKSLWELSRIVWKKAASQDVDGEWGSARRRMLVFTLPHLSQPVCFRARAVTACAGAGIRCKENGPFPHPPGLRPRLLLPTATGLPCPAPRRRRACRPWPARACLRSCSSCPW